MHPSSSVQVKWLLEFLLLPLDIPFSSHSRVANYSENPQLIFDFFCLAHLTWSGTFIFYNSIEHCRHRWTEFFIFIVEVTSMAESLWALWRTKGSQLTVSLVVESNEHWNFLSSNCLSVKSHNCFCLIFVFTCSWLIFLCFCCSRFIIITLLCRTICGPVMFTLSSTLMIS